MNRAGGYGWRVMAVTESQAPRRHHQHGSRCPYKMATA